MRKKIWFGLIGISFVITFLIILQTNFENSIEPEPEPTSESEQGSKLSSNPVEIASIDGDIVMTSKSSRPGCEKSNSCYVPHELTINIGEFVTWKNTDVAFHSVTSGFYNSPSGLFDSGHLDPDQSFSVNFKEQGQFDYFCTLHPWMQGTVYVE